VSKPLYDQPLAKDWLAWLTTLGIVAGVMSTLQTDDGSMPVAMVIDVAFAVVIQFLFFGLIPGLIRRKVRSRPKRSPKANQRAGSPLQVVADDMANRDPVALEVAKHALSDWLAKYPELAQLAGESDHGATGTPRMLTEAWAAASAVRGVSEAGASMDGLFNEQCFLAQNQARVGITREWTVAFMQIRCISIGYMLGFLGHENEAAEFGAEFRAFMAERE
jgi:hypothetical protein